MKTGEIIAVVTTLFFLVMVTFTEYDNQSGSFAFKYRKTFTEPKPNPTHFQFDIGNGIPDSVAFVVSPGDTIWYSRTK